MAYEVAKTDSLVTDEVATTYLVHTATVDTKVMTPALTEPSVYTDEEFSKGPID